VTDDVAASFDAFADALEDSGRPVLTAAELARSLAVDEDEAADLLADLQAAGEVARAASTDPPVWYPAEWEQVARRERVIPFPERREIVAHHPEQFTRAQLAQFARLVDATGEGAFMYEVEESDVWQAPYEDLSALLRTVRQALGGTYEGFEEWVGDQWRRARQFTLRTHDDGYVVLEAASESLMGNVARQKLDEDVLRAPISDTESWVAEGTVAELKRVLYDGGYPVVDERDLDTGEPLDVDLTLELRDYQQEWVDRFVERRSGVLVGPPGSGKTVAAMGVMSEVGGETLVLVPSRELAGQWREAMLDQTTLDPDQVGEYHGGTKDVRPVTVATYQIAGMDRHRELFDSREWGLVVLDECLGGDTTIETPQGKTTFDELDRRHGFDDGWNRNVDLSVRTFDPISGEFGFDDVVGVFTAERPVVEVRTNMGRTMTATSNHTHLIFDPETGSICEQTGVDSGDFLIRPTPDEALSDGAVTPTESDLAAAELLGWVLGDGHVNEYGGVKFSFARRPEQQRGVIEALCESVGLTYSVFENARGDHSLNANDCAEVLGVSHLDGDKTTTVSVPNRCYTWGTDRIAALLRGLFDAEGSVDKKGRIQFNTVSPALAEDVGLLLQKVGFPSRLLRIDREKDVHSTIHRVTIASAYGTDFDRSVGFRLTHKRERLQSGASPATGVPAGPLLENVKSDVGLTTADLSDMMGLSATTVGDVIRGRYRLGQGNLDSLADGLRSFAEDVPDSAAELRERHNVTYEELGENVGLPTSTTYRHVERESEAVLDGLTRISDRSCSAAETYARRLEQLSDVTIVEVESTEERGTERVYDLETDSHTFVADGILTHNCHHIPAPVFRRAADLQSRHRLGLSATPVRGDDREDDIFTLVGPPLGTDWDALFDAGFVARPGVEIRYLPWADEMARNEWASAEGHQRRQLAAGNPAKTDETRRLLAAHDGQPALVFVDYLDHGERMADALDLPFVSGETPHARRRQLLRQFREGERDALVVSRVGDEGIDLPGAEVAVVASGLGGSRRQGAQRAGRTMRPEGTAQVYLLATQGTGEEEFARKRTRHLAEKGVQVTETRVEGDGTDEPVVEADEAGDDARSRDSDTQ
jgi:DNA excision repair protein ERCC-3